MNADRLIRKAINMLLRRGMRRLNEGQKQTPQDKQVQQSVRMTNRIRRM